MTENAAGGGLRRRRVSGDLDAFAFVCCPPFLPSLITQAEKAASMPPAWRDAKKGHGHLKG